jgi:5-methyltetrahydrofolate--homocysteine methyltransferase
MNKLMPEIADKLDSTDPQKISEVLIDIKQALEKGVAPNLIIDKGLLEGLGRVGAKFKAGTIFIPEVLVVAKIVRGAMDILRPHMTKGEVIYRGKVVLGTVRGDLHDIGKNLVGIMLEAAGFKIIDIGVNVPSEKFVETAQKHGADIVGLSALLTTTMSEMGKVIEQIQSTGLDTNVIVGGAPITQEFADEIGADAYAVNAGEAVDKVLELL